MNETIYDLIDAIKEDKRYLQFKEQSLKLLNQETKELLDNYQNLLQELDDLKKFEKYIDLTQKRQELNEEKECHKMKTFKNIIKVIIKSMNYSMKLQKLFLKILVIH